MSLGIENLEVSLQKNKILKNINLNIENGEFISLLGPSGCGKSTLLKSIAGLLEKDSGKIYIKDEDVEYLPPEKRGAIIVFQDLRLFPNMTVEKNIGFSLELKKVKKNLQKNIISNLLRDVQLEGFEKRKITEMSGGQLQRIALARALATEPKILLLDEPFSSLDEEFRLEMRKLVKKLQEERNLTTILVTHDKQEAIQVSDRIAVMENGEIKLIDTPYNIINLNIEYEKNSLNKIVGNVKDGFFKNEFCSWKVDIEDGNYEVIISEDGMNFNYFKVKE
ncbi:ABC transporter ATP-binding protein [Miniphocaeibacter massiliensis]|uniref:ABC transporter ATP-binding protein n=1 Tax=Miniphocaeibacter massiliensis TaxID=2041841 RepID=UPI000C0817AC|nr:ABC transporter ATP-binding protein [Miniphocaeibacter massiliensis]